jgi:uncharacterized RDD family membrane protein YckC
MAEPGPTGQEPAPAPSQAPAPLPSGSGGWGQGAGTAAPAFPIKTVQTEKGPAAGVAYAELPIRIGAFLIDGVILSVCYFIVASILVGALVFSGAWYITWLLIVVLYVAGSAAYFIWSWTNLRASPGQRLLSLETVNAGSGATLTTAQAGRRYLFLFGPVLLSQVLSVGGGFTLAGLGYLVSIAALIYAIWLLYSVTQSSKRQGFHDLQADTVVVRRTPATS